MSSPSRLPLVVFTLALLCGGSALWLALRETEPASRAHPGGGALASQGETSPRAKLRDPLDGTLSGKLVDAAGAPRAGARVRAWFLPEVHYAPQALLRRSLSPTLELEAETDADGLFAIALPASGSRAHALVLIEEPQCAPIYAPAFDLVGTRQRELGTLALARGGALRAHVVRRDGSAPREALRATLVQALEATSGELRAPLGALRDVRELRAEVDPSSGLCTLDALPRGRYCLAIESAEGSSFAASLSAPFEIPAEGTTEIEVLLEESAPLEVRVRDARGELLAGAEVIVASALEELPRPLARRGRTNAEGRFETTLAPARGELLVSVAKAGFQRVERRVRGSAPLQSFLLQPEVVLRGIVRDARTGAAIPEAWIGSFPAEEAATKPLDRPLWATRALFPGRSDAAGRFALPGHGQGRWQVVAKHGEYLLERSAPIEVQDGAELPEIELRLDPGIAIEVQLLDPSGAALAEAGLSLRRAPEPGDEPWIEGRFALPPRGVEIYAGASDARGRASFRLLRPGAYRLYVRHRRWQAWPPFELELAADRPQQSFELRLEEPGSWHGRVTIGEVPTRERKIFAVHASGLVFDALPDDEGRYAIAGVPPGAYVLEPRETSISLAQVAWEQFRSPKKAVAPAVARELGAGTSAEQDFALEGPKLARVRGALSLDGQRYGVWLVPMDVPLQGSLAQQRGTSSDASGQFAFADVPFGSYRLVVNPAGASPIASGDPRASAEQTFRSFEVGRALLVQEVSIDTAEVDLGFLAARTAVATGTVVDATGNPLGPGFVISKRAGIGAFRAEIDDSGRFRLGELPHGELELVVHVGERKPATRVLRFAGESLRIEL
ncbi:MAG: hypothetical protein JNM84_18940 [Planctomycetes bacterium]|nr:hypothetical protein [Planctomycetota bacterium]